MAKMAIAACLIGAIVLVWGRKEIVIWGSGLKMKNYVNNSCIVNGKIASVEIISGGAVKE